MHSIHAAMQLHLAWFGLQTHLILRLSRYCDAHCMYHVCHSGSCVAFAVFACITYYLGRYLCRRRNKRCSVRSPRQKTAVFEYSRVTSAVPGELRSSPQRFCSCMEQNYSSFMLHNVSEVLRSSCSKRGSASSRRAMLPIRLDRPQLQGRCSYSFVQWFSLLFFAFCLKANWLSRTL